MEYCKNGDVRFNLLNKAGSKSSQIWLIFNFDGNRLRHYTGKRIDPANWDFSKQRVKTQCTEAGFINGYLKKLARFIEETYSNEKILEKNPTVESLKEKINNLDKPIIKTSFIEEFQKFIDKSKTTKSPNTIKNYNNALNHLKKFSSNKKDFLEFGKIDGKFYDLYKSYLIDDIKLTNNTVSKQFKVLKVFMNYATDHGLNSKLDYNKFKSPEVEGEIIFLSWKELMKLYNLKIKNNTLEKVRDVFCFECFTGLRYSDIQNLNKASIVNGFLHVNIIKKREKKIVTVPLISYAKKIIAKYSKYDSKNLLPVISNQKMNDYLKVIGKNAKLKEPVIIVQYQGAMRIETVLPKYEVLTTHIGRKTFITNALERGVTPEVIMSITDHATHKAFKRYYKIVDDHKKRELIKAFSK